MDCDFDPLETRRMFLAGTVPFPTPFPTIGTIKIRPCLVSLQADQASDEPAVIVEEPLRFDNTVTRKIFLKDVTAVFVSDIKDEEYLDPCRRKCVDFEKGKWFLGDRVRDCLGIGDQFRGIVFVESDAPVFSRIDLTLPAEDACIFDLPMLVKSGCLCPCRH